MSLTRDPNQFRSQPNDRVQNGFNQRLEERVRRMRKLFAQKNWEEFQMECQRLARTATAQGYPRLTQLAISIDRFLENEIRSRAAIASDIRSTTEVLFSEIDLVLTTASLKSQYRHRFH